MPQPTPSAPNPINDPGLLTAAETSLLMDQYELMMAASYFRRDMNEPAIFSSSRATCRHTATGC